MTTEEFEKKTVDALCKNMDEHPEDWIINDKDEKTIDEYCTLLRKDGLTVWCYINAYIYKPNEYKFQIPEHKLKFHNSVKNLKIRLFNERQRQIRLRKDAELEKTQEELCNMLGINSLKEERKEKLEHLAHEQKHIPSKEKKEGKVKQFFKKLF